MACTTQVGCELRWGSTDLTLQCILELTHQEAAPDCGQRPYECLVNKKQGSVTAVVAYLVAVSLFLFIRSYIT